MNLLTKANFSTLAFIKSEYINLNNKINKISLLVDSEKTKILENSETSFSDVHNVIL